MKRPWLLLLALFSAASCRQAEESMPAAVSLPTVTTKTGAEMVLVPAGRFTMGSPGGKPDEAPAHEVSIEAFWIDRTEVTQEQYGKLVLGNPSHFKGPDRPVEQVSWAAAARYCNERSRDEGLEPCYDEDARCNFQASGYRLPTEAEWEYACRAGSDGDYCFGSDGRRLKDYAWDAANASKKTQPVAGKKPNAWGLFDMHGNVAEWCNDVYAADYYGQSPPQDPRGPAEGEKYVLRGGAWNSDPEACRSSARVGEDPGFQDACFARDAIGFRCVRRAQAGSASHAGPKPPEKQSPKQPASQGDPVSQDPTSSKNTGKPPTTGFVYGEIYLRHKTGEGHPERPERLVSIVRRLEKTGLLDRLVRIDPAPAAMESLTAVHAPGYVERVRKTCLAGSGFLDSPDTPVMQDSYDAALAAAGGVMAAIDAVVAGRAKNAFCAVRPPGHHASRDRAMGFCLLNNVAIAARYAQRKHNLAKVLVVDWDVHHGNGTQAIFDDDPTVLYFSVHQSPFYPFTGHAEDRGTGKGAGTKINVPLPAPSGDDQYKKAFEEKLRPAALAFRPELVLISAGFDAHEHDLLGQMKVTTQGFAELTRIVRQIADQCCGGRLVSVLEGGYNLLALADAVEAHLRVLIE